MDRINRIFQDLQENSSFSTPPDAIARLYLPVCPSDCSQEMGVTTLRKLKISCKS
jgi:hypothetical protein